MADREALEVYLRTLDPQRLHDIITLLEAYEDQFEPKHVVPGTIVLLNLLPELPERQQGMFELPSSFVVSRVTYRLLKSLNNADRVESAVREILPELNSLFAKLEVISDVGHRKDRGHKLVPEVAAADFERVWRDEVRAKSAADLAKEIDLLTVLLIAKREADSDEPKLEIHDSPHLTLAILRAARSETRSQTAGSRAIRRTPRLAWDSLIELYGDAETLKRRIEGIKAIGAGDAEELLELADNCLRESRTKDFAI